MIGVGGKNLRLGLARVDLFFLGVKGSRNVIDEYHHRRMFHASERL